MVRCELLEANPWEEGGLHTVLVEALARLVHVRVELDLVARRLMLEVRHVHDLFEVADAEVGDADRARPARVLDRLHVLPGLLNCRVARLWEVVRPVDQVEVDVSEPQLLQGLLKGLGDVLQARPGFSGHCGR